MNEADHVDAGDAGFEVVDRRRLVLCGLAAVAGAGAVASVAGPADAANGGPVVLGAANTASDTTKVTTTTGHGLQGSTSASGGFGVLGISSRGNGVYGQSSAPGFTAVLGKNTDTTTGGFGVRGVAGSKGTGVRGETSDRNGSGVHGVALTSTAAGVRGDAQSDFGQGVYGRGNTGVYGFSSATSGGTGVRGDASSDGGYGIIGTGATGVYGTTTSEYGSGLYGTATEAFSYGVRGSAAGGVSHGLYGSATGYQGTGVLGYASGVNSYGVNGIASNSGSYAGWFDGNVHVQGILSKSGGSFRIDHPLDPGNKFLSHSFVESPDMKNIYDGVVVLDGRGEATVEMPDWFDALNRDFRYQLTAIGDAAPNLRVASEMKDRRFTIAGGGDGQKVSWQVTGIRQDAWANSNRIPIEEDKTGAERGKYLHPELIKGGKAKPLHELPKLPSPPEVKTPPRPPAADLHAPVR